MSNTSAFLRMVYACEGTAGPDGYRMLYGGGLFDNFDDHPRRSVTTGGYTSTAAGRPQILASTWDAFIKAKGPHRFDEEGQDACALWLIADRHALADVESGLLASAIDKTCRIWASLPGSPYGQPTRSYAYCEQHYLAAGGVLHAQGDVVPNSGTIVLDLSTLQPSGSGGNTPKVNTMGAALTLLPLLAQFIPQILTLIKPGSVSTAKDAAIAQTILNTVVQAAGVVSNGPATAQSVGAAVDAMHADPELAKKVQEAVVTQPEVMQALVVEIGSGGIAGARDAGLASQNAEKPFWYNPTFWITVACFPMMYAIVYSVLFTIAPSFGATAGEVAVLPWYAQIGFDPTTRSGLANLIVGFLFGSVFGMWFGASFAQKKDAAK